MNNNFFGTGPTFEDDTFTQTKLTGFGHKPLNNIILVGNDLVKRIDDDPNLEIGFVDKMAFQLGTYVAYTYNPNTMELKDEYKLRTRHNDDTGSGSSPAKDGEVFKDSKADS